jgi:hypothetical protein
MDGDACLGVLMAACLGPPQRQNQLRKINCPKSIPNEAVKAR